ncbi:helix-turn-helix transcriptional regulator [Aneurinibacillus thermoaerophilus]|uniref:Transcriptional regulator, contains XRE-family HTH domain n=1 Tax=Aneurinibacillus thermoaerophilus TaxID=143495 RepID=A0A1G8FNM1_ANETH|nr:helix-turn-helix transcriptional regulator [Aneurinibacillus thermoaerophilus]MED0758306.1 helix-turn-helix transcriptional regulator [Aneurinibacillus thermoaerophilus]MED0761971.1 helix-turn-helix transcriptional regulator [Aneurinibacillus thermoaerophilus]SDH83750.1 Transcriptional regulator, contains XRE-family HTH domain [Aneurinibacillus thermoaerophilus]
MLTLGQRIKQRRKERKMTQAQVAKELGIDNTTVSKWESDTYQPDAENLKKLANLLLTTTDYLTGRTNDPSPKESDKKMNLFFYDGLEGYEDLSPEEQEAFREHMYEEARQAIELVKKLKKKK